MARQTLTILLLMLGAMLLLRGGCSPAEEAPPAETVERVFLPAPEDRAVLRDESTGLAITFDHRGTLVSVAQGDEEIVRPLPRSRGVFSLLLATKEDRKRDLPREPDAWRRIDVPGGIEFRHERDGLALVKRYLLAEEGSGVDLLLKIAGAPQDVRGFELTCAAGVSFAEEGGDRGGAASGAEGGIAFWKLATEEAWSRNLDECREEQEGRRRTLLARARDEERPLPRPLDLSRRRKLDGGSVVERFGLLGAHHYLAMEGLPAVDALNLVSFRTDRGGRETREIETWASLLAIDRGYEGTFRLRWAPRDEAAKRAPELAKFAAAAQERRVTLENGTMRVELSDRGAALTGLWLKSFTSSVGEPLGPETWLHMVGKGVRSADRPLLMHFDDPDQLGGNPAVLPWRLAEATPVHAYFTLETPRGYRLEKRISLPEEGRFDLRVEIRIVRPSGTPVERAHFRITGPSGAYLLDAYRGIIGAEPPAGMILERRGGEDEESDLETLSKREEPLLHRYGPESRHHARAVGVRGAFFLCALVTEERLDREGKPLGDVAEAGVRPVDLAVPDKRPDGETLRRSLLGYLMLDLPFDAGSAASNLTLYAGPNDLTHLRPLRVEPAIDFGFFGSIGRFLMWLMKLLQGIVGSYGVAIMLMTVIVRAVLLPVSYKTQLSMQRYGTRMQKLKPILQELEQKFGKNPQKLNAERMRVMREHKVGFPLGCLTMFLQIPIWFALFGALRVEFSLRHAPFLWAGDLSMPDRVAPLPFWPHWLNLLPLLMLVLWVLQQKATPTPNSDDPQVQAQMKIVRFMPYIFFFMLYNYAAALSVYMCVSSAWGIIEGRMVRKAIQKHTP